MYLTTAERAKLPVVNLSKYQTVSEHASVMSLEKAMPIQAGKVSMDDIQDALSEYTNLYKAGLASKAEILTLSRAFPNDMEYANAARDIHKSVDVDPMVIGGPASVQLIDREGHLITTGALERAFQKFMKNDRARNVMVLHSDVQVGWALPAYISKGGHIFKSGVDDSGLFFICEIRDDTTIAKKVTDQINQGLLKSYSIAGSATKVQNMTKGLTPYLQVDDMELAEVTVCEKGVNQGASFELLKAEVPQTGKIDKDQCGYRDASTVENMQGINCGHCKYFNEDDKTCDTVSGDIQPKDYCKIFAPRKAGMDKKILMVQVHRDDDGKVDFHKSFEAWISKAQKEKDPLKSKESFVTLNNEAGRQAEHQQLLREYGFPEAMDTNSMRYVPVVEVETDEDGKPIHNLPPWVVNEAGEMLGDRLDEDAPTYKNSAKSKARKKSGALQKFILHDNVVKARINLNPRNQPSNPQYDAEKQGVQNRLRQGQTGVPKGWERVRRFLEGKGAGQEYHSGSYFSSEADHARFLNELADKKIDGTITSEEEIYANKHPEYQRIIQEGADTTASRRSGFESDVSTREQERKDYGQGRSLPYNQDEVEEHHRMLGIGGERVFNHPNHHGVSYADQRADIRDRWLQSGPDGKPRAFQKRTLHEHLADLDHLSRMGNGGKQIAHMKVDLPSGTNAYSMMDHHDVTGLIDNGHIQFHSVPHHPHTKPSERWTEDQVREHLNVVINKYRTPSELLNLKDLGGQAPTAGGTPESPQGGGSRYAESPEEMRALMSGERSITGTGEQAMVGRQRAGGNEALESRTSAQGVLPNAYDAIGESRDVTPGKLGGGEGGNKALNWGGTGALPTGTSTSLGTPPTGQTRMTLPPSPPDNNNLIDRPYQKSISKSALDLFITKALGGKRNAKK